MKELALVTKISYKLDSFETLNTTLIYQLSLISFARLTMLFLFLIECDFTTDESKCTGCVSGGRGRYIDSSDRCLCKCIIFTLRVCCHMSYLPTLHIGQINIPNVTDCRYLGITISVKKNCDLDLKRQMRKCYANVNMLLRKFVKCSLDVKCYLFKTYCCNLYCALFWYDSTKAAMKSLKVAYNK